MKATINKQPRDTRIDFFRGLALITIYINHIPRTAFEHFTHRNIGFSDAAEAFVLLAGLSSAYAYGLKFEQHQRLIVSWKAIRRAGTLYSAHIVSTMLALMIFAIGAVALDRPRLLEVNNIAPLIDDPVAGLIGLASLSHQLGYFNILPMYAVLLVMLPVGLLIAQRSLNWMLIISVVTWIICMRFKINIPAYPNPGGWFFNPLTWQVIYFIGLFIGLNHARGKTIGFSKVIYTLAVVYLIFALLYVKVPLWGLGGKLGLPWYVWGFDKTYVSLSRLMHLLALAYFLAYTPLIASLSRVHIDHPIALLGRYALPVFLSGSVLCVLMQVIKSVTNENLVIDFFLISIGLVIQYGVARLFDYFKSTKVER